MPPPADAFKPGTRLTVGAQQVVVTKYFSHGGFAQVYICTYNGETACLKRVVVPDKPSLNILRKEVDAMRRLKGKPHIVSYIDSNASRSPNGYEVLVLMEYCAKGGLIDFMNSKLVQRLNEAEVLTIMAQITEAVAYMHSLSPAIVHRDIKIENVLISDDGEYKLCDFGSSTSPLLPPKNVEEFQILQDDIMKNTTPQYRSPEMLDLYRGHSIDEKSDIWALGVFMYKLCYYTTPFEHNTINGNGNGGGGDYAIMHCIYSFPSHPVYSPRLKNIISKVLISDPNMRPNVYQLLDELCKMRGVSTPVIPKLKLNPQQTPNLTIKTPSQSNGMYSAQAQLSAVGMAPKKSNTVYSSASSMISNGADSMYSIASPSMNTTNSMKLDPSHIDQGVKVSRSKSSRSSTSRRPVSMYGSTPDFINSSKDDLSSMINELKIEDVKLSPNSGSKKNSKKHENISSSMDFLRTLSRQNTNKTGGQSNQQQQKQQGTGSEFKWKKRSSISSLKDLLTGGSSSSNFHNQQSSSKRSSMEINTPKRIKSNTGISTLEDLKEMSPDNKQIKKLLVQESSTGAIPKKKVSLIQERTARLFRRANVSEPPEVKTAHGYGKYTDLDLANANKVFKTPSPDPASSSRTKVNIIDKKPAPPPRPKKPTYLKSSNNDKNKTVNDLDLMEAKFHKMFPPAPKV